MIVEKAYAINSTLAQECMLCQRMNEFVFDIPCMETVSRLETYTTDGAGQVLVQGE